MTERNPGNGRNSGRAFSHKTELRLFLEKFDHARRSQWQNLLSLQAEQLSLLGSLIETRGAGRAQEPMN